MAHLPINRSEMIAYGWDELDFLFISGDAYIDHPSFGCAILTRLLVDAGYRVGIIAQPDVNDPQSLQLMGRPKLGVLASSGVVDSMVNHYTAAKRKRSTDVYSPGGKSGFRPDRALIRYGQMVREQFGSIPLIIGGVEAGLRRFAHYDYWSNSVRNSILQDSTADILIYGEGENTLLEIAGFLARGIPVKRLVAVKGTAVLVHQEQMPRQMADFIGRVTERFFEADPEELSKPVDLPHSGHLILLPSADQLRTNRVAYAVTSRMLERYQDPASALTFIQAHRDRYVVQNPVRPYLTTSDLDHVYGLPYERSEHPVYAKKGGVPAIETVRFSITAHRGCYGGCSFCAIGHHMGRIVRARSDQSILAEAERISQMPDFKGIITDVGGPTANFHAPACEKQSNGAVCHERACLHPSPCKQLSVDHQAYFKLLDQIRALPGIRKVFISSGIRYDIFMADPQAERYLETLCRYHISGQLKIAPEHISPSVLKAMGKPGVETYNHFSERYRLTNERLKRRQFLVPYLISGHPGSTLDDAIELALFLKREKRVPEQVQDFYPTPGTLSTAMYYTGLDPFTLNPVHIPDEREKRLQRALLQPTLNKNRPLVIQALQTAGRTDLIGRGPDALIPDTNIMKRRR